MKLLVKLKKKLRFFYDSLTSVYIQVGIGDLLLPRGGVSYIQMITVGRYLDTMAFCENEDSSFFIKNSIGTSTRHDFDAPAGDKKFINLIDSYKKNGYDNLSKILVDGDLIVKNGTHRLGLHLFLNIPLINAQIQKRTRHDNTNLDNLIKRGVSTEVLKKLQNGLDRMVEKLAEIGQCFTILINGPSSNDKISIIDDISFLAHIIHIYPCESGREGHQKTLLQVWLENPDYFVDNHGGYYSKRAKDIEEILNHRVLGKQLNSEIRVSKNCIEGMQWFLLFQKGKDD